MISKDGQDRLDLLKWARENSPGLLDEMFFSYDGWSQLSILQWAKAKHSLFDEGRIDTIGQNGNDGEHYEVVDGDK